MIFISGEGRKKQQKIKRTKPNQENNKKVKVNLKVEGNNNK
jgi:hypothetical protein